MTDETKILPPLAPAHAAKEETVTLKTVIGDSAGLTITAAAVAVTLILVVVGVIQFILGSATAGLSCEVGAVLVVLLYTLFTVRVYRWYARTNQKEVAAYARWRTWLIDTYGLQLTDVQNDELVNFSNYRARQTGEGVWGSISAVLSGRNTVLRLVGDEENGYSLQVKAEDGSFTPLPLTAQR